MMELINKQNAIRIEEGRRIISKMNAERMMSFPEPHQLFPDSEDVTNYAMILVNKDKEANLFPLNYP
jgi:hypothetical protein